MAADQPGLVSRQEPPASTTVLPQRLNIRPGACKAGSNSLLRVSLPSLVFPSPWGAQALPFGLLVKYDVFYCVRSSSDAVQEMNIAGFAGLGETERLGLLPCPWDSRKSDRNWQSFKSKLESSSCFSLCKPVSRATPLRSELYQHYGTRRCVSCIAPLPRLSHYSAEVGSWNTEFSTRGVAVI